jgi:hypothetical protein
VAREVAQAAGMVRRCAYQACEDTDQVRRMLMRRSQPQPVIINAAAGGRMIATCK